MPTSSCSRGRRLFRLEPWRCSTPSQPCRQNARPNLSSTELALLLELRLNRPLSTRISMLLARARLSPDLVTWLAFALEVVAAALLAAWQGLAGGLVTHVAFA